MPIAAIVSPGTMIVTPSMGNKTVFHGVPQFDYRNFVPFLARLSSGTGGITGLGQDILRLALGSVTTESILTIKPPAVNSTYSLDFYAPALKCELSPAEDATSLHSQYRAWIDLQDHQLIYYSWVPSGPCPNGSIANYPPFDSTTFSTFDQCAFDFKGSADDGRPARLNIFLPTHPYGWLMANSVLLNCSLNNASYTVGFAFRDGAQLLDVKRKELVNGVQNFPYSVSNFTDDSIPLASKVAVYNSIMDAFGRIMVGKVQTLNWGYPTPISTLIMSTGMRKLLPTADNATLAPAVELLFQNITLSFLSDTRYTVDL